MTTTVPTSTRPSTVSRRAKLGAAGGTLWALFPVAWLVADPRDQELYTLSSVAVLASFWLVAVVGPALIVVGHTALRSALGGAAGRTFSVGIGMAALGFSAVAIGNSIEVASLSAGGDTSVAGYVVFYVGFLVAFVGSLLTGVTLLRRRLAASRLAAWMLVLAIPLGIGIGVVFALIAPEHEAGFSAAVAVPTGVAWALLGRSLAAGHEGAPVSR